MFPDQNAVSTVRLLQMAQQRATNGNSPILELYNNNYAAAGNQSYPGYGTTLLKNQDAGMWASRHQHLQPAGRRLCARVDHAGQNDQCAQNLHRHGRLDSRRSYGAGSLISANSATLQGGWGSEEPGFDTTPPTVPTLSVESGREFLRQPHFYLNSPTAGDTCHVPCSRPRITPDWAITTISLTPQETQQAHKLTIAERSIRRHHASPRWTSAWQHWLHRSDRRGPAAVPWQTIAEPVNVTSGEFYEDTADLSLPGPLPLQLRRNYTSQNLQANEFGYGWKMNFNPFLVIASNIIYAAELDGTMLAYRLTNSVWKVLPQDNPTLNNNSIYGVGSTANLFNSVLTTNSGTNYVIAAPDGSQRTYQVMSFPVMSGTNTLSRTRPYLTRWQDAAGNYAQFYYGTNAHGGRLGPVEPDQHGQRQHAGLQIRFLRTNHPGHHRRRAVCLLSV